MAAPQIEPRGCDNSQRDDQTIQLEANDTGEQSVKTPSQGKSRVLFKSKAVQRHSEDTNEPAPPWKTSPAAKELNQQATQNDIRLSLNTEKTSQRRDNTCQKEQVNEQASALRGSGKSSTLLETPKQVGEGETIVHRDSANQQPAGVNPASGNETEKDRENRSEEDGVSLTAIEIVPTAETSQREIKTETKQLVKGIITSSSDSEQTSSSDQDSDGDCQFSIDDELNVSVDAESDNACGNEIIISSSAEEISSSDEESVEVCEDHGKNPGKVDVRSLLSRIEMVSQNMSDVSGELADAKEKLEKYAHKCTGHLVDKKKEIQKKVAKNAAFLAKLKAVFKNLQTKVQEQWEGVTAEIDKEFKAVTEDAMMLDSIRETTCPAMTSEEDIQSRLKAVEKIETKVKMKRRTFNYYKYNHHTSFEAKLDSWCKKEKLKPLTEKHFEILDKCIVQKALCVVFHGAKVTVKKQGRTKAAQSEKKNKEKRPASNKSARSAELTGKKAKKRDRTEKTGDKRSASKPRQTVATQVRQFAKPVVPPSDLVTRPPLKRKKQKRCHSMVAALNRRGEVMRARAACRAAMNPPASRSDSDSTVGKLVNGKLVVGWW